MSECTEWLVRDSRGMEFRRNDEAHARGSAERWNHAMPGCAPHEVIRRTITITDEVMS